MSKKELENALLGANAGIKKPVEDHLGNIYPTKKEMCAFYGVPFQTYAYRLNHGWTLEAALTTPSTPQVTRNEPIDHKGIRYPTIKEMCDAYGVRVATYMYRRNHGWDIKSALTTPLNGKPETDAMPFTDHKGNRYPTLQSMCSAYGIRPALYSSRINRGKSIAEALETPIENRGVEYAGKTYPSLKELAKEYNLTANTIRARLWLGWTLEEAITEHVTNRVSYDHLGKRYQTQKEMCQAYGVEYTTFRKRLKLGWTTEQALLGSRKK